MSENKFPEKKGLRSDGITAGVEHAPQRSLLNALGLTKEEGPGAHESRQDHGSSKDGYS